MRRIALSLTSLIFVALGSIAHAQIPNVPDAARYAAYSVTSATANFDVPFALYGDCTDLTVKVAGVAQPSGWTCNSKGGQPLANIARPVTDAQIVFTTAVSNALVEVTGAWHPRWSMGTAPGITRAEFNRDLGTVLSKQRELFDQASLFAAGRMPVGIGAPSSGVGATGDYYLDISTANVYGPKTSTSWPSVALFSLATPVQMNAPGSAVTANITDFIFAGETTIDNALTRATASFGGTNGGTLRFPARSTCYSMTQPFIFTSNYITFKGDGRETSCITLTGNTDAIVVGDGTANPHGFDVRDLTINRTGAVTTGAAIRLRNTYDSHITDVTCGGTQFVCVDVDGGPNQYATWIDRLSCFAGFDCIRLGNAGGQASETWINDSKPSGQTNAALHAISVGGLYMKSNSYLNNTRSWLFRPGAAQQVSGWSSDHDILDTQTAEAAVLDGTNGFVSQGRVTGTWFATCGTNAHESCIVVEGSTTNTRSIAFDNILVFAGRGNGINLLGGRDITISGQIASNGFVTNSTCNGDLTHPHSGVVVSSGVSNWSVEGRSGLQSSDTVNCQDYGVVVGAGGSDYYRITGEFSNNNSADVLDQGTGAHKLINTVGGRFKIAGAPITFQDFTGYFHPNGSSAATASPTVPTTDLSGTLQAAQEPAHTGDVTNTAGSLALTYTGIVPATKGGTGQSVFAVGDLLYASTTTVISKLADVATGNVLRSGGVGVAPAWGKINLSTDLDANTLPTANSAALSGDVTKTAGTNNTVLVTAQPAVHTWALTQTFTVAPVFTDQSGTRTALGLGTAATQAGTSGAIVGTTDTQTLTNKSIDASEVNSGALADARIPTTFTTSKNFTGGLQINGNNLDGAWTSYNPVVGGGATPTCSSGTATGSMAGAYKKIGDKTVAFRTKITITAVTSCVNPQFLLPFAPNADLGVAGSTYGGYGGIAVSAAIGAGSTTITVLKYDATNIATTTGTILFQTVYDIP